MENRYLNKAYRILFWATLCSMITLDLDLGARFSTEILFYILFATGSNLLYDETKNPCFKIAYAISMAGIAVYILLFVAAFHVEDAMIYGLLTIMLPSFLAIGMVTTVFLGTGQILPEFHEQMKRSANIYAGATTAITLVQMVLLLWNGIVIIGLLQIAVQIWIMTVLAACRKRFPPQEQEDVE